jgi:hypothetical protein
MSKRTGRPSPALAISLVALFVALGGTGYAAISINGKNIVNKSIAGKKLKDKAIGAGKVKTDTLTGTQVNESTLGAVPSATQADTAASAANATNAANAANAANADRLEGKTAAEVGLPVAYGRVTSAGKFDAADSKGIVSVTESPTIANGGYCIDLEQPVEVAVANASFGDDVFARVYPGAGFLVCPNGTELTVITRDVSSDTDEDETFYFIAY